MHDFDVGAFVQLDRLASVRRACGAIDEGIGCGGYFCEAHRQGYRRLRGATAAGSDYHA